MFSVVLYQPEIPPNTGNVIRLCANSGAGLHLVKPLGFTLEDKQLRRAGLDYHEYASLTVHEDWDACLTHFTGQRLFALTTKGGTLYHEIRFQAGDVFVFGPETRGLPVEILNDFPDSQCLRIPMRPHNRSLNLSNAVAVLVYEAWRQTGFADGV